MSLAESFIAEFTHESAITRRFLERLPEEKLTWKPHEKSNTAGALALHIAQSPGPLSMMVLPDRLEIGSGPGPFAQPTSLEQVLGAHDESLKMVTGNLRKLSDADFGATWTMTSNGRTLMSLPRAAIVRSLIFSHIIQHRGQFGVYLRLLGAKVPASYGPSGDELPDFML